MNYLTKMLCNFSAAKYILQVIKQLQFMQRIKSLIERLKELDEQGAGVHQIKMVAQLLLAEIQQQEIKSKQQASSRVAVVMPAGTVTAREEEPVTREELIEEEVVPEPEILPRKKVIPVAKKEIAAKELNEAIASPSESLNDKLKEEKTEIAEVLTETPIKDLRKAISLNDRFIFIAELFNNDEALFDKSVKTINAFHIFSEATYWIEREISSKFSWDNKSEAVQHFMSLVRRRFA